MVENEQIINKDNLNTSIDRFGDTQILCVGDVMLDRFIYGSVDRVSPEAPIPVIKYDRENIMLGGAGNVVRNLSSLGASTSFISVIGRDEVGNQIAELTGSEEKVFPYLITDKNRISTEKTRYISASQQLFRADKESDFVISKAINKQILEIIKDEIAKHQVVVLSDYDKGVFSDELIKAIIALAKSNDIPIIIDPKSTDYNVYSEATIITPNLKELSLAVGKTLNENSEIISAAQEIITKYNIDNMLVTLGAKGMVLVTKDDEKSNGYFIDAQAREVFDVSGAGDTVVVTLATAISSGTTLREAAFIANAAASIVVAKIGTATVYRTDLKSAIHTIDSITGKRKVFPQNIAMDQVTSWQREGHKVGFTNGCFDIVHAGHLALINDAKSHCDKLVLAINSDESVKRLKGDSRPVNNEMDRATLLAELYAVDMVVIFREDTPEALLQKLKPDVLMKGADYQESEIVGAEFVKSYGGEIKRINLKDGYSTTGTIEKIRAS